VVLALAVVALFRLRAHVALAGYVVGELAAVVAPSTKSKNPNK
jgi:hypothetical protein